MMQTAALVLVIAAGLWLIGVGFLMALRPAVCLRLIDTMRTSLLQSNWRLQITEQGLRILAGVALIVRAPQSEFPLAFEIGGWLLVLSSVLILLAPIRWHGAYGTLLVNWLNALAIRLLFPVPALVGAGLIYAALPN